MQYEIVIKSKYNELQALIVFEPLKPNTVISWGADKKEKDGIKKWTVIGCAPKTVQ